MKYVVVDVETDGPVPGLDLYSMIEIGAIIVNEDGWFDPKARYFHSPIRPISNNWVPEALAVSGRTREELMCLDANYFGAEATMGRFSDWVKGEQYKGERMCFVSDNAGFDWMFVCWYLHKYTGANPMGFSPFSLTSYFKGRKGMHESFQRYRSKVSPVKHTHQALDDACGNAYALQALLRNN